MSLKLSLFCWRAIHDNYFILNISKFHLSKYQVYSKNLIYYDILFFMYTKLSGEN